MDKIHVGQKVSMTKVITKEGIRSFAQLTGDTNPLHLDENYARTTRFKKCIAHGIFTAGLVSAVLGTQLPGPGAIYLEQKIRFLKPAYLGDTITATVEVIEYREAEGTVILRTD